MISIQLISGDMTVGADGTVTAIDGDRVYAFGHRFLAEGSTDMPFARAEVLAALEAVDLVVVFDQDTPLELIKRVCPAVLVKGADYTREEVVGRAVVEKAGGDVVLVDLVPGHSTTAIVERARPVKQAVED